MLSRCPVLSVPTGQATNGVPTGMQIVGRTYREQDIFGVAHAYQQAVSGWYDTRAKRPVIWPFESNVS